jgi:hypothetical protein
VTRGVERTALTTVRRMTNTMMSGGGGMMGFR